LLPHRNKLCTSRDAWILSPRTGVLNASLTTSNVCVPTESSIAWPEFWVGGSIAAAIATVVSTTGRFRAKLRRRISLAHSSSSVTGTPRAWRSDSESRSTGSSSHRPRGKRCSPGRRPPSWPEPADFTRVPHARRPRRPARPVHRRLSTVIRQMRLLGGGRDRTGTMRPALSRQSL